MSELRFHAVARHEHDWHTSPVSPDHWQCALCGEFGFSRVQPFGDVMTPEEIEYLEKALATPAPPCQIVPKMLPRQ